MGGKNLIKSNRKVILEGMRDGIPIGLGYLAVSFSLGIAAKAAGLNAFQSFIASLLCNASAGEYSGFTSYFVIALATLVANARYLLMSCALSQRISKDTSIIHRLLLGFFVTDEFFGISISRSGKLNPFYTYGAILIGCPCWAFGSMLGTIAGNLLPLRIVSALSVALFGMFLAIIVPPSRKNKTLLGIVLVSFAASFAFAYLPVINQIDEGTRTIILTIVISAAAALLFPVKEEEENENVA
mgnify:CR=1 FL=1